MVNTVVEFTLMDDSVVKMTLTYARLYKVRAENKEVYDRYNKIMMEGSKDEFDNLFLLYTAYLCGLIGTDETPMSYEDFMEAVPPNRREVQTAIRKLVYPTKK